MARTVAVRRGGFSVLLVFAASACSMLGNPQKTHPQALPPTDNAGFEVWRAASAAEGRRIMISLEQKQLWLIEGRDTLFTAPVAVGTGDRFSYNGRDWHFKTPRGRRTVRGKEPDPIWVPPDWHYYEKAVARNLEAVHLKPGQRVELSDGTRIEVRGEQVGRVNQYGNFWPFTPGTEIIFDGIIFVPPFGTAQRRVPDTLGTHKIDLGDAYLIHGTYEEESIGRAASHGCIRMYNEDVANLYGMVRVGMPVYIY